MAISFCRYNCGIDCPEADRHCETCGWQPEVNQKRLNAMRSGQPIPPSTLPTRDPAVPARRPVEKVDRDGNVVEAYESIQEAARKNFASAAYISQRCNSKVSIRSTFGRTGCTFRFAK